jgi:type VII secretion protein EccB
MRTKREQVAAHRFIVRRIISAMVSGEPETLDLPMRRMAMSAIAGTAIAALVFAGFWVVGLIWPGGAQSWQVDGAIIVEEETGTRFVYWEGQLHPVRNYASALLITSSGDREVHTVHQESLADTPRGGLLGISDAPDALPTADLFVSTPWQTCSARDPIDPTAFDSHVVIGEELGHGTPLDDSGVLLSQGDKVFLVVGNTKYLVPSKKAMPALGADEEQIIAADSVLVNSLYTGPDLKIEVPKMGDKGRELDGESYDIGAVFTNNDRYYVLLDDGLAAIGELAAELIGTTQVPLSTSEVAANGSDSVIEPADFPSSRPQMVSDMAGDDTAICSVYSGGELSVRMYSPIPQRLSDNTMTAPTGEADEVNTADHVLLPGGYGALIRAESSPGAKGGTVYLVTDQGWKFGLTADTLAAFGYKDVRATAVPSSLVALLPTGPNLTQAAALGIS